MTHTRYTPFFVAGSLPLLLIAWFAPKGVAQADLWLLWLVAMLFLALPLLFLEKALAHRSDNTPLLGMQLLTRQADSSIRWRAFSWLSLIVGLVLAAGLIGNSSAQLITLPQLATTPSIAIGFALTVMALILSPLKQKLILPTFALASLSIIVALLDGWHGIAMTNVYFDEWATAVLMAVLSMGTGSGLYWFLNKNTNQTTTPLTTAPLTRQNIIKLWLIQLALGSIAFIAHTGTSTNGVVIIAKAIACLCFAGFLLFYVQNQLAHKIGTIKAIISTIIAALLLAILPSDLLRQIFIVLGLISVLILAIFAGFIMKISHLRKSLQFGSELSYNLWRVMIRWLVPIGIGLALIGQLF